MAKRPTRLRPSQGGAFFPPVYPQADLARAVPQRAAAHERCGCGDPNCSLPPGRCLLCKRPIANSRTYAVCSACDEAHAIRTRWANEYARNEARAASAECFCPGWLWMNEDDDASFNIERCDTCALVEDDLAAAELMVATVEILPDSIEWP